MAVRDARIAAPADLAEGEKSGRRLRYRKAEWGAAAGH